MNFEFIAVILEFRMDISRCCLSSSELYAGPTKLRLSSPDPFY